MSNIFNNPQNLLEILWKKIQDNIFKWIHSNNLIYNTCREDPRIDRQLLELKNDSKIVMITSAWCNALDYLLDNPEKIYCIDVNPKQNALMNLKLSFYKYWNFNDFEKFFLNWNHENYKKIYTSLREYLPLFATKFWDKKIWYFSKKNIKWSFYYRWTSWFFAWLLIEYIYQTKKNVFKNLRSLFNANTLQEQENIYNECEKDLWDNINQWILKKNLTMSLLWVPRPQVDLLEKNYVWWVFWFIKDNIRYIFTKINAKDNYFYHAYIFWNYTKTCCPNYVKQENFEFYKNNINKISTYNNYITNFLIENPWKYSHFVLLDHMDWLANNDLVALKNEWNQIFKNSFPWTKILFRSAWDNCLFLPKEIIEKLEFNDKLTFELQKNDRVHTYWWTFLATVK